MNRLHLVAIFLILSISTFSQDEEIAQLKIQIEKTTSKRAKVDLLHQYVWELSYYDPSSSIEPAREALELSIELDDSSLIAQSYNRIGLVHDYAGNFELAEKYYIKSYGIMKRVDGESKTDGVLNNLGSIYYYLGRYQESMDYYLKSLKIREDKKDENDPETLKKIAQSYNNIGLLLKRQQNYSGAVEYYQKALEIKANLGDASGEIVSRSNLGSLYMAIDSVELSYVEFQKALDLTDSLDDFVAKAMLLNNLGLLKVKENAFRSAENYYNKSVTLYSEINDMNGEATVLLNLSSLYFDLKRTTDARNTAEKVLRIGKTTGSVDVEITALHLLSKIEESVNPKKSLGYLQEYITLKDSVDAVEITQQINQQAVMYETEKKENEIELLKKDQTIQQAEIESQDIVISRNRNYMIFLMLGIVMLIVIGVSLVLYFRSRKEAAEERASKLHTQHQREIDGLRSLLSKEVEIERSEDLSFGISQDDLNQYLLNPLSEREIEVLYKIAKGKMNKEIADELFISVNTVKTHILHIYEKLAVQNRTEAAVKANSMKIIK
ncbi:MAG: DNA-binding CsgD family transcriptional regulator/Tfp pilus assembly protein PilF [Arenicella sp.]|jgi:DNA-binding CsgD family transcriptional regulator/Tfp pilus assembly protein PilF